MVSNGGVSGSSGNYTIKLTTSMSSDTGEKYTMSSALDNRYVELQGTTANRSPDTNFVSTCSYATPNNKQSDVLHVFTLATASTVTVENVTTANGLVALAVEIGVGLVKDDEERVPIEGARQSDALERSGLLRAVLNV